MSTSNSNSRLLPIAIIGLILLLGVSGYLAYQNNQLKSNYTQLENRLDETEILKKDVEKQYYESLAELEELKGSNEELNALIDEQKAKLKSDKKRIDGLLRDKRNLRSVRKELAALKTKTAEYVAEIGKLREENEQLAAANVNLNQENQNLQASVAAKTQTNQELSAAKAALVSEKKVLMEERAALTNTVTLASVVKVNEVKVTGLKLKKSGKTVRKRYAKNVDLLNICFKTSENEVAVAGSEQFHVRLINPIGETLAIEEMGSGVLTNSATKEQVRYTKIANHQYNNDATEVCVTWDTPIKLSKGTYKVEVYNKGFLAGKGTFRLK